MIPRSPENHRTNCTYPYVCACVCESKKGRVGGREIERAIERESVCARAAETMQSESARAREGVCVWVMGGG